MVSPTGRATTAASAVTKSVPATSGSTPKAVGLRIGVHRVPDMNSQTETSLKKPTDWLNRMKTIPMVVRMEMSAHPKNTHRTIVPSTRRPRPRRNLLEATLSWLPVSMSPAFDTVVSNDAPRCGLSHMVQALEIAFHDLPRDGMDRR